MPTTLTDCINDYDPDLCEKFRDAELAYTPPDCGGCWCIPEGGSDVGTCPDWEPEKEYSD